MNRLAILGASGHGKVVADTAECCGWNSISFFDDDWPTLKICNGWQVVGDTAHLLEKLHEFDGVFVAIGNNRVRLDKLNQLLSLGAHVPSLIHPFTSISQYAHINSGVVVMAGSVVNANASIGMGVILNTSCSVDHDCVIGEGVHISPGARLAGGVKVEALAWVGIGASVRQLICIGANAMVGAGAVVIRNVEQDSMVLGNPAKVYSRS